MLNVRNIPHNIVSPMDHCYGSKDCHASSLIGVMKTYAVHATHNALPKNA
jgi:hypothetical protein